MFIEINTKTFCIKLLVFPRDVVTSDVWRHLVATGRTKNTETHDVDRM